jgi:type IV pilus assembly protein PilE
MASASVRIGTGAVQRCHAFTLLEMMIVCSLIAVLLSLSIPSYQQYLLRAHRSAAIEALLTAAACQERIYASEFNYDTRRCLSPGNQAFYQVRFQPAESAATNGFVVIADPVQAQAEDLCGSLSLDQSGSRGISGPAERMRRCWEGR